MRAVCRLRKSKPMRRRKSNSWRGGRDCRGGVKTDEAAQEQAHGEAEETAGVVKIDEAVQEQAPGEGSDRQGRRRNKSKLPVRRNRLPESSRSTTTRRQRKNKLLLARPPFNKAGGATRASSW